MNQSIRHLPVMMLITIALSIFGCVPEDVWVALGSIGTVAAFAFAYYAWKADRVYKKSQFYLEQIKLYFKDALSFFDDKNNNNIKWHTGISYLKTINELSFFLTESSHKLIYQEDYLIWSYQLINIIEAIEHFEFFYGLKDYIDVPTEKLYTESTIFSKCKRINPDDLKFLCIFLENAGKLYYSKVFNKADDNIIFNKIEIYNYDELYLMSPVPKVREYIKNFNFLDLKR